MSNSKAILVAGCLITAAVAAHAYTNRYEISGSGSSVWKLDRFTGAVSVCAIAIPGGNLAAVLKLVAQEGSPRRVRIIELDPVTMKPIEGQAVEAPKASRARNNVAEAELLSPGCSSWF